MNKYYEEYQIYNLTDVQVKNDLWLNKILNLYQIVDQTKVEEIILSGISITKEYYRILTKERLNIITNIIKKGQAIIIVAIPDTLHQYVYNISEDFFNEYKSQFNYETNEDYMLDEISSSYTIWNVLDDELMNFMPRSLVYGIISLDDKNELKFYKNQKYFEYLSDVEKKHLCEIIKKGTSEDIEYEKYLSLICDYYKFQNQLQEKKETILTKKLTPTNHKK